MSNWFLGFLDRLKASLLAVFYVIWWITLELIYISSLVIFFLFIVIECLLRFTLCFPFWLFTGRSLLRRPYSLDILCNIVEYI